MERKPFEWMAVSSVGFVGPASLLGNQYHILFFYLLIIEFSTSPAIWFSTL
jgi:hypothetical protein